MSKTTPSSQLQKTRIEPDYTAPLTIPAATLPETKAELLRLPKSPQRDPIFSLSRSTWNLLILPCKANDFKPPIKSVSMRRPGTVRGVRLIVVASARAYFQRLIDEEAK